MKEGKRGTGERGRREELGPNRHPKLDPSQKAFNRPTTHHPPTTTTPTPPSPYSQSRALVLPELPPLLKLYRIPELPKILELPGIQDMPTANWEHIIFVQYLFPRHRHVSV